MEAAAASDEVAAWHKFGAVPGGCARLSCQMAMLDGCGALLLPIAAANFCAAVPCQPLGGAQPRTASSIKDSGRCRRAAPPGITSGGMPALAARNSAHAASSAASPLAWACRHTCTHTTALLATGVRCRRRCVHFLTWLLAPKHLPMLSSLQPRSTLAAAGVRTLSFLHCRRTYACVCQRVHG